MAAVPVSHWRRQSPPRRDSNGQEDNPADALSDRVSVLPRSILRTVDRIRQDLDPKAEAAGGQKLPQF